MREQSGRVESQREEFADGSALVTYADGSQLILESRLARQAVIREERSSSYNDPPPALASSMRPLSKS